MKIERLFRYCLLAGTCLLASCSNENDVSDGDRLPEGQYPVTFTATGLEAMTTTRATADGTWTGGEEVAVKIGDNVKKYTSKSSTSNTTTLEAADANDAFYWEKNNETKTVLAWYPHSSTLPESFTVKADQSGTTSDGFQASDFLYATPVEVFFGNEAGLTFKHLTAKVVINLKADTQNGVTETEVQNAVVTLVNQAITSGTITYDSESGAATVAVAVGTDVILPKTMTTGAGYHQTVQALVVPQQMKGKQFIKVTIVSGATERNYYYTPANDTDANLQSGNQYTYDITVKDSGYLEVTIADGSGTWTGGGTTPVESKP